MPLAKKIADKLSSGGGKLRPDLLSFHTPKTQEPRTKTHKGQPPPGRGGRVGMANRVIRDSIHRSRSLPKLTREAHAWYPHWVLMADDWGCFDADPRVIKGEVYPFRDDVQPAEVEAWLVEYHNSGHVFLWTDDGETLWGFFTAWDRNNTHFNRTNADNEGKHQKHRRKTPEPPKEALTAYLKEVKQITGILDILGHLGTPLNKILNPNHNPNPKHNQIQIRGARKAAPPPPGFNLLVGKLQEAWKKKYGANLNWQGKDGATLKALVARNEEALICEGWQLYLDDPDDYCRQNGQSFLNFASMFDKVVSRLAQKKKEQEWLEGKTA